MRVEVRWRGHDPRPAKWIGRPTANREPERFREIPGKLSEVKKMRRRQGLMAVFNVPRVGGGLLIPNQGEDLHVDTDVGSDTNTGEGHSPLATIDEVFSRLADNPERYHNGAAYITGRVRYQGVAPVGVYGFRLIGAHGGANRHDKRGSRWDPPASTTAGEPLITLLDEGWEVQNFLMAPLTNSPAIRIRRAEDATYPDGGKALIRRVKFQGDDVTPAGFGVESHGGPAFVEIEDCDFFGLVTSIKHVTGAGIASPLRWRIRRNWFGTGTNHIILPGNQCVIEQNIFDNPATVVINTSGGTEGKNYVINNQFSDAEADIDNAHGYTGHAADVWRNFSANVAAMYPGVPGA
jgi:hypothetical protein